MVLDPIAPCESLADIRCQRSAITKPTLEDPDLRGLRGLQPPLNFEMEKKML